MQDRSVQEKKMSVLAMTIGSACLFIGLFLGVPLFIFGLVITISTIIFSNTGYDATGLGIIVGPPMIVAGVIFSCSLILAVRLLNLRPKQLLMPAIIIALFPLFFGMRETISWKLKIDRERRKMQKQEEEFNLKGVNILKKFENNTIVQVRFAFMYADDYQSKRKADESDLEMRKTLNRKFVVDNIIDPIGTSDMPKFRMEDNSVYYIVDVTKNGYEKLKNNKYATWIELWK